MFFLAFVAAFLTQHAFFLARQENTHWVGDITYIRTHQGWSYLACVLDLATKEIVGWALSQSPNAELAKAALSHAIRRKRPDTKKLQFHSDPSAPSYLMKYLGLLSPNIHSHTERIMGAPVRPYISQFDILVSYQYIRDHVNLCPSLGNKNL